MQDIYGGNSPVSRKASFPCDLLGRAWEQWAVAVKHGFGVGLVLNVGRIWLRHGDVWHFPERPTGFVLSPAASLFGNLRVGLSGILCSMYSARVKVLSETLPQGAPSLGRSPNSPPAPKFTGRSTLRGLPNWPRGASRSEEQKGPAAGQRVEH